MKRIRTCDYDFSPQLKKHIREPEVEHVYNRSAVYEKTINILFKAANSKLNHETEDSKLCNSGKENFESSACKFCEKRSNYSYLNTCDLCSDYFCQDCCFMRYRKEGDVRICFSCYT